MIKSKPIIILQNCCLYSQFWSGPSRKHSILFLGMSKAAILDLFTQLSGPHWIPQSAAWFDPFIVRDHSCQYVNCFSIVLDKSWTFPQLFYILQYWSIVESGINVDNSIPVTCKHPSLLSGFTRQFSHYGGDAY